MGFRKILFDPKRLQVEKEGLKHFLLNLFFFPVERDWNPGFASLPWSQRCSSWWRSSRHRTNPSSAERHQADAGKIQVLICFVIFLLLLFYVCCCCSYLLMLLRLFSCCFWCCCCCFSVVVVIVVVVDNLQTTDRFFLVQKGIRPMLEKYWLMFCFVTLCLLLLLL